jgi:2-hydroxychromene-2-carboxylate isomerase
MRAATYACQIGRAVAFSLAAFRQAFAAGRDLGAPDNVLIAAAACEMHPRAVLKGAALHSIATALEEATALAARRGVHDVPAMWLPVGQDGAGQRGRVFHGEDALDGVARALTA